MSDYAMVMPAPGGPEGFVRRDVAVGAPGPGEALVRHTAVGLNFIDIYQRQGLYPWPAGRDQVLGAEAAGVVEAVGAGVEAVAPGDRVAYTISFGGYVTARVVPAERLVRLPDAVPDAVAATLMVRGLTAQYLIHSTFRVAPGMTVLVHAAAGGVGLLLGQWLAAKGATAIGTAGGPDKVALALSHGYEHAVDYRAADFVAEVKAATGGEGCHVVYDSVGRDTWEGSLQCLRPRGTLVVFGQSSGRIEGFSIADLAAGSLYATRPSLGHYIATRTELESRAKDLFAALAAGVLTAEVRQRFALAEVAEAHRALEGRRTTGACVLIP